MNMGEKQMKEFRRKFGEKRELKATGFGEGEKRNYKEEGESNSKGGRNKSGKEGRRMDNLLWHSGCGECLLIF